MTRFLFWSDSKMQWYQDIIQWQLRQDFSPSGIPEAEIFGRKRTFSAFRPSVSAAEFKGWIWPNVKFQNFKRKRCLLHLQKQIARQIILDKKLYLLKPMRIQRKKLPYGSFLHDQIKKKIRLFARYAKSPLFLHIFVHSASVFGLRPDVFLARYSVLA